MTNFTVTVEGGTVDLVGEVSGEGPTFVWGHALSAPRRVEDRAGVFDWSDVGARVVRYDARSQGESSTDPRPEHHRWPALAEDMLAVASRAGVERAVFGGASMGAATSIWAATLAPTRVAGLVLVIPPTAWEHRRSQSRLYGAFGRAATSPPLIRPLQWTLRLPRPRPRPGTRGALIDAVIGEVSRSSPERLAPLFQGAAGSDLPPVEVLAELEMPALILAWTGDRSHPMSVATTLASVLPNAELDVVADDPLACTRRVARFLTDLPP